MPIRILIADDHALLRQGIKNALSLEADLEPKFPLIFIPTNYFSA